MRLFELQSGSLGPAVDQQLQGVAQGINQNNNQPTAPMASQPDPNLDLEDEEEETPRNVDPDLVTAVKGLPYVKDYEFDETNKIAPYNLLQLEVGELVKVRNLVRAKIGMKTMSDQIGLYDDPGMKFYMDLMSFVEKVIQEKKAKERDTDDSPAANAEREKPNNPAPKSNAR